MIFGKNINDINIDDINELIGEVENNFLEFKEQLDTKNDLQKAEFLRDISALANSNGGYYILGIEEKEGAATKIVGIEFNEDRDTQKLESIIHTPSSLRPRLSAFKIKPIDVGNNKKVVIIEVQPSLNAPHQVTFNNENRFYIRNEKGKNQPDVDQLRQLFLGSEGIQKKIRDFRDTRIVTINERRTPVSCPYFPLLAIHIIPYSAYKNGGDFSVTELKNHANYFEPRKTWPIIEKINIDGLVLHTPDTPNSGLQTYTQIYRNGRVEAVYELSARSQTGKVVSSELRNDILNSFNFLNGLKKLNINSPIVLFISLIRVKNFSLVKSFYQHDLVRRDICSDMTQFDRDIIKIPDLVIEDIYALDEKKFESLLKSTFDIIANAAGLASWNE